jgi:anti-anti-sigma factor
MIFRTKKQDDFTVLIFETPNLLNGLDIETIEKAITAILDGGAIHLLLDFYRVKHASSQALSMILRVHMRLKQTPGGELILSDINPQLLEAIQILRLDRLISIFPTRREALRARRNPKDKT